MSKHEAKISKNKYIVILVFAILLSLGIGMGLGFLLSQSRIGQSKLNPENTQTDLTPKDDNAAQNNVPTKEELQTIVNTAMGEYYNINSTAYSSLKTQSLDESKKTKKPQETIFKEKLYSLYQNILTKTELTAMKTFIDSGNLKGNYYLDFFNTIKDAKAQSTEIIETKENIIKATSQVSNSLEYNTTAKLPSSQDYFNKLKGKGLNQKQYAKLVSLKPSKVAVSQINDVNIILEKENNKWLISDYTTTLVSTEITQITINNKKFSLSEFIKTYPVR